jgi:hypothetical protein
MLRLFFGRGSEHAVEGEDNVRVSSGVGGIGNGIRIERVGVEPSVWDLSEDGLQVAAAVSGSGSFGLGGPIASAEVQPESNEYSAGGTGSAVAVRSSGMGRT